MKLGRTERAAHVNGGTRRPHSLDPRNPHREVRPLNDDRRDAAHRKLLPGLDLAVAIRAEFDLGKNISALAMIRDELDVSLAVAMDWYKRLTGFTPGSRRTPFSSGFATGAKWAREKIEAAAAKAEPVKADPNIADEMFTELHGRIKSMSTGDIISLFREISKAAKRASTD